MDLRAWLESGKRPSPGTLTSPAPSKEARRDEEEVPVFSKDKAEELLELDEFKNQSLEVRNAEIRCLVCKATVGCERRLIRQHCFRSQKASARVDFEKESEEEKLKLRHYKKMVRAKEEERKAGILHKAIAINRQRVFEKAEDAVVMRKNLDDLTIARRITAFETLAGVGIPLSKLDDAAFLSLIEGDGPRLGGRRGLIDVQSFVQQRQMEALRSTLKGRPIGLFCDGSKANFLIEATVARFVTDGGQIVHVCIGLSRIDRSLDGIQLKGFVQHHLDAASLSKGQVMAVTTDSAAVNKAMGKQFNWEVCSFPEATRFSNSFPIHHCFSHMITNSGAKWRESMQASIEILSGLKGLRVSDSAKALFLEMTGTVLPDGTENRWFYWVDFVKAVLPHWNVLPAFVRRCKDDGYMPKKVAKMNTLISPNTKRDALKAGLELQFMVLLGEPLARAAYFLEGDGFLAPFTFARLSSINDLLLRLAGMDAVEDNEYLAAMRDFANRHPGGQYRNVIEDVIAEVWGTRNVLANSWRDSVWNGMRWDIVVFKGFSVLDPLQLRQMTNGEIVERLNGLREGEELVNGTNAFRRFKGVKGLNEIVQDRLIAQLPAYRATADQFAPFLLAVHPAEQPAKLWEWWWTLRNEEGLSQWSLLACLGVLHQPSSAVIERFFSVYKGMTTPQQYLEDEETSLLRALARYNKGKVGL